MTKVKTETVCIMEGCKFTFEERSLVKSLVATLTLKRLSDTEVNKEVERETNNTMSRSNKAIGVVKK